MNPPVFVFVHGSWHGAWCFEKVRKVLENLGFQTVAQDLPGHGIRAKAPNAYSVRPLVIPGSINTEPSPLAGVTLAEYVAQVEQTCKILRSQGKRVILIGHSMAGIILNAVGELLGKDGLDRIIYLTAFMPASNQPLGAILQSPSQATSLVPQLFLADPSVIGALRIDPNSVSPAYNALVKNALYADVSDDEIKAVRNLLTPDDPAQPFGVPVPLTVSKWGLIPRTYIKCTADNAIKLETQNRMITAADLFNPLNLTRVSTLIGSSHSPFFSQAAALASHIRLGY